MAPIGLSSRLAAVAVLALLAVSSINGALAVKAGDTCGPSHDKTAKWMSIPASSLVASGTAGAPSAVNGCVTSDRGLAANVHVHLPNGTWNIYNVTARLKAVAPVNASATLSILVGDAGAPLLVLQCVMCRSACLQHQSQRLWLGWQLADAIRDSMPAVLLLQQRYACICMGPRG